MTDTSTVHVQTPVGQYDVPTWQGRNVSGIMPFGDMVLILPDISSAVRGGIHLPPEAIERISSAAETGWLVAAADGAWVWNSDRSRKYEGRRPQPGDRVYFERYAGAQYHGVDGALYRLMTDKCIGGLAVEPEAVPEPAAPAVHVAEALKLQEAIVADAPPTAPVDLPTIATLAEGPKPKFPQFAMKDGVTIMAFNRDEMRTKAEGSALRWFDTQEQAIDAALHRGG